MNFINYIKNIFYTGKQERVKETVLIDQLITYKYRDYNRPEKIEVELAENIFNGKFSPKPETWNYFDLKMPSWLTEDYKDIPNVSWDLHRHSLEWLIPLINQSSKNLEYKPFVEDIIYDWIEKNPVGSNNSSKYVWYDHSVSMRAKVLCYFVKSYPESEISNYSLIITSINEHAFFLNDLDNHPNNKHSLFMFCALAVVAVNFPKQESANKWFNTAITGIRNFCDKYYSSMSIHMEQSPIYHLFVTRNIMRFIYFMKMNNEISLIPNELIKRLENMVINWPVFLRKDGSILMQGDTPLKFVDNSEDRINDIFYLRDNILCKNSKSVYHNTFSSNNFSLFHCQESGYLIMTQYPFRQVFNNSGRDMHISLKCRSFKSAHYHNDGLSLNVYNKGIDWITDSGYLNYDEKSDERKYFRSSRAHNAILLNDENHETIKSDYDTVISTTKYDRLVAECKMVHPKFTHTRNLTLSVDDIALKDSIVCTEKSVLSQLFHLHPEVEVEAINCSDIIIKHNSNYMVIHQLCEGSWHVEKGLKEPQLQGWYSEEYNKITPINTITFKTSEVTNYKFNTTIKFYNKNDFNTIYKAEVFERENKFNPHIYTNLFPELITKKNMAGNTAIFDYFKENGPVDIEFLTNELNRNISDPYRNLLHFNFLIPNYSPPKKLKILYLVYTSLPHNISGYTIRTQSLLSKLVAKGVDIRVIGRLNYPKLINIENYNKSYSKDGVEYCFFEKDRKFNELEYFREYAAYVIDYVIKNEITVIQAASSYINGVIATMVGKMLGIPSVYEIRGLWEYTKVFEEGLDEKSIRFLYLKYMEGLAAKNVDLTLTLTENLKQEMVYRGVPENNISVIANGVNIEDYVADDSVKQSLIEKHNLSGKKIIGYVGSLTKYEGLDVLLRAMKKLIKTYTEIHLIIVGDGREFENLKSLVLELGIENYATFTGRLKPEEAKSYYNVIDIAPFPRHKAKVTNLVSPLKPFEAMAYKKPVVLSDVDVTFEYIEDGKNGLIFTANDEVDLAAKLEMLIDNEKLYSQMSNFAYQWVKENRSWDIITEKLVEDYQKLI